MDLMLVSDWGWLSAPEITVMINRRVRSEMNSPAGNCNQIKRNCLNIGTVMALLTLCPNIYMSDARLCRARHCFGFFFHLLIQLKSNIIGVDASTSPSLWCGKKTKFRQCLSFLFAAALAWFMIIFIACFPIKLMRACVCLCDWSSESIAHNDASRTNWKSLSRNV